LSSFNKLQILYRFTRSHWPTIKVKPAQCVGFCVFNAWMVKDFSFRIKITFNSNGQKMFMSL